MQRCWLLQGGVVAAFGLVRGSAQADMLQLSASNPFESDTLAQVQTVHECRNCSSCQCRILSAGCCVHMLPQVLMCTKAMSPQSCKDSLLH